MMNETIDKKTIGKKSRAQGKAFETKVRKDLEEEGWIVSKWSNNVEFEEILKETLQERLEKGNLPEWNKFGKLIPAKSQYNPFFKRIIGEGSGFPDFIAFRDYDTELNKIIIGVESKINGTLDRLEKEKCKWLLKNGIFKKIFIASKGIKSKVIYTEFVSEN